MYRLRTFGSLSLEGSNLTGAKPLVLLTHLAIEGPQSRRRLAELFWPQAADPLNQLSVTLVRLTRLAPGTFRASATLVEATVGCDALELQSSLDAGDLDRARGLYRGQFLLGVKVRAASTELEEWIEDTKDRLARHLQSRLLACAGELIASGRRSQGTALVRAALKVADSSLLEADDLSLAHDLLTATSDFAAKSVRREVMSLGLARAVDGTEASPRRRRTDAKRLAVGAGARRERDRGGGFRLIGRDRERQLLLGLLTDERLRCVTVAGPGGVGKSVLARAVVDDLAVTGAFPGGIATIRCHGSAGTDVERAVHRALGVPVTAAGPDVENLDEAVASTPPVLLVLDDFDHLAGNSPWLGTVLETYPGLSVLITSVRPLRDLQEAVVHLDGMSAEGPFGGAAAELFLDRARCADGTFEFMANDLYHLRRLTALTGGLPLALEMAATLVTVMSLREIADEAARGATILSAEGSGERHRNLLAVFERCWATCDDRERSQMVKLAVFRGPFDRRSAQEVADVGPHELAGLMSRSLLARAAAGRFEVNAIFRGWLRDRLETAPDVLTEVMRRHAEYFAREAVAAGERLDSVEGGRWLARLDECRHDVLAAIEWTSNSGDTERTLDLLSPLAEYWVRRGCLDLVMPYYDRVASAAVPERLATRMADCLRAHAFARLATGQWRGVSDLLGRALELAEAGRDPRTLARVLNANGVLAIHRLLFSVAEEWYRKALVIATQHGFVDDVGRALNNLGDVRLYSGRPQQANAYYVQALDIERSIGNLQMVSNVLGSIGLVAAHQGRLADAERALRESLQLLTDLGITFSLATALEQYAALFVAAKRPQVAGRLFGAAETLRSRLGTPLEAFAALDQRLWLSKAAAILGEAALAAAVADGRLLDADAARDLAVAEGRRLAEHVAVRQGERGLIAPTPVNLDTASA